MLWREDVISMKCDSSHREQLGSGPVSKAREHLLKGFCLGRNEDNSCPNFEMGKRRPDKSPLENWHALA